MNFPNLVLTLLFAVTVWADTNLVYEGNLFVKVENEFSPITHHSYSFSEKQAYILKYIDPDTFPTKFTWSEKSISSKEGILGFYEDYLTMGIGSEATSWFLDKEGRVLNVPFYSCDLFGYRARYIKVEDDSTSNSKCVKIDIYFLRPDKTPIPVIASTETKGKPPQSSKTTHFFVARVNNKDHPLSNHATGQGLNALTYAESSVDLEEAAQFILENNYAIPINRPIKGKVGLKNGILVFDEVNGIQLIWDKNKKLQNGPFYSCVIEAGRRRGIHFGARSPGIFSDCLAADIYLFSKETKPNEDEHQKPPIRPLVFFAKVNGELEPLSRVSHDLGEALSYGIHPAEPVKFLFDGSYASTIDTAEPLHAGFPNNLFVVGSFAEKPRLDLDKDSKLKNGPFYSCNEANKLVHYIVKDNGLKPDKECSKVDIYLLPPDATIQNVMPNAEGDTEQEGLEKEEGGTEKSPALVDPSHGSGTKINPSVMGDHSYVFVAVFNGTQKLLSSGSDNRSGNNVRYLYYANTPKDPVEFDFNEGYVTTKFTPTPESVGFRNGSIVFGPGVSRRKLNFDSDKKLQNGGFHACYSRQTSTLSADKMNDDCPKVEIYLRRYDRATGTAEPVVVHPKKGDPGDDSTSSNEQVPKDPQVNGDGTSDSAAPAPLNPGVDDSTDKEVGTDNKSVGDESDDKSKNETNENDSIGEGGMNTPGDSDIGNPKSGSTDMSRDNGVTKSKDSADSDNSDKKGSSSGNDLTPPNSGGPEVSNERKSSRDPDRTKPDVSGSSKASENHGMSSDRKGFGSPDNVAHFDNSSHSDNSYNNGGSVVKSGGRDSSRHSEPPKDTDDSVNAGKSGKAGEPINTGSTTSKEHKPKTKVPQSQERVNENAILEEEVKPGRANSSTSQKSTFNAVRPNIGSEKSNCSDSSVEVSKPHDSSAKTSGDFLESGDSVELSALTICNGCRPPNQFGTSQSSETSGASKSEGMIKSPSSDELKNNAGSDDSNIKGVPKEPNGTSIPTRISPTATNCTQCENVQVISTWKKYTDYTRYFPEPTTVTFAIYDTTCHRSSVTVTTPTTLTVAGVCEVAETITVDASEHRTALAQGTTTVKLPIETTVGQSSPKPTKTSFPEFANAASKRSIGLYMLGFAVFIL